MRVGIIVDEGLPAQGTGCLQYVRHLVRHVAEQAPDDEFALVHARGSGRRFPVPARNVRWVEVPFDRRVLHRLAWPVLGHPRVERFTGQIDVFHNTLTTTSAPSSAPTVVTIHDLYPERFGVAKRRFFRRRLLRQAAGAAAVIADSEATRRDVIEMLDVPPARVHCVPLGLPERQPAPAAADPDVLAAYGLDGPFLLFVGRMDGRKNLPTLVKAFATFRAGREPGPLLVLAGTDGGRSGEVREVAARLGVQEAVRILGFVPDAHVPVLMRRAVAFVYPSLHEGFGLPLLEAMDAGTPVAASATSSIPELTGDAAVYFDPADPAGLARAMATVADDEAVRRRLTTEGRRRVARFGWSDTARRTLAVYREVAGGQRA